MSLSAETEFNYCLSFLDEWTPWQFGKITCYCTKESIGTLVPLMILLSFTFAMKVFAVYEQGTIWKPASILCYASFVLSLAFVSVSLTTASLGHYDEKLLWCIMGHGGSYASLSTWWHFQMAQDALYNLAILTIKSSLVVLYFGTFTNNRLSKKSRLKSAMGALLIGNTVVLVAWAAIAWFYYSKLYRPDLEELNSDIQWTSEELAGYMNAVTDLCLLVIPIYGTWNLNMSRKKRRALAFILFLGSMATLASIARGATKTYSKNLHWSVAKRCFVKMIFQNLEVILGYVCYCLPACRGYIRNSKQMQACNLAMKAVWVKIVSIFRGRRAGALARGESQVELVGRRSSFQSGV